MLHIYDHEIMCVTENKEEMYIHLTLTLHIGMSDGYSDGSLVKHHLKKKWPLCILIASQLSPACRPSQCHSDCGTLHPQCISSEDAAPPHQGIDRPTPSLTPGVLSKQLLR